jgi:Tol biopolymer transport system component
VNIDGSDTTQLTRDPDYTNSSPEWSPDGSKILFSRQAGTSVAAKTDVHVMNANGSDVENFTKQPEVNDGDATWSPDGRQIAFVRGDCSEFSPDVQNPCDIWRMRADGSSPTQITSNTDDNYSPDWLPFGAGVIAQGNEDDTGTGQENGSDTGNAGTDTAADNQYNDDGDGNGSDVSNPNDVIDDTTSKKQLPNTGGAAILAPAIGLVLISGLVARSVVRRR